MRHDIRKIKKNLDVPGGHARLSASSSIPDAYSYDKWCMPPSQI